MDLASLSKSTSVEVNELWLAFKRDGKTECRDILIRHYMPLVQYAAASIKQTLPSHITVEDLVSYGIFGLIDAIEKFEPERGFKFETYSRVRIRGAMLDELRSEDWVPRSIRARNRLYALAKARLETELQRAPTDLELAIEVDTTVEEIQKFNQSIISSIGALEEVISEEDGKQVTIGETIYEIEDDALEAIEPIAVAVSDYIYKLPERELYVLKLYYYEGLTLAEIGHILGVTESRVCQIHTKAISQLGSSNGLLP